jgi:hypothetical protein
MNIEPTHELENFDVEEDVSAAELVLFFCSSISGDKK